MESTAISHGAATIINAIATGKGAAFGISLETKARVKLNDSGEFSARIKDNTGEDTTLIELCAKKVINHFGLKYGAFIETESEIPIARGLKSSSTAANSVILATIGAIRKEHDIEIDDLTMIKLGVDAAIEAKVTITGAFDDASASFFGGWVITDNTKREILKSGSMEPISVLVFVPEKKTYTSGVNVGRTKLLEKEVLLAWNEAINGDLYRAMVLNGILYSATMRQNTEVSLSALGAGAVAAGLSGTGPAVVALSDNSDKIKEAWSEFEGSVIETGINNKKAEIIN